jgi:2-oxoglutarate dehydrogenase E1 component
VSDLKELTDGQFGEFLDDPTPPKKIETLILCSGKIYYDLLEERENIRTNKAAIVRVEQFYPFNEDRFKEVTAPYAKAKRIVWCQEEPENMGAWNFLSPIFKKHLGVRPEYVGRTPSASPATGSLTMHRKEQAEIVAKALGIDSSTT